MLNSHILVPPTKLVPLGKSQFLLEKAGMHVATQASSSPNRHLLPCQGQDLSHVYTSPMRRGDTCWASAHRRLGVACSQVPPSTADGPVCPYRLILSHWHLHSLWRVALGKSLMQVKGGGQTKTSFSYRGSIRLAYPSSRCPCRWATGRSSAYTKERCAALLIHSWR